MLVGAGPLPVTGQQPAATAGAAPAPIQVISPNPRLQPVDAVQSQCPEPLGHVTAGSTVSSLDWVELQRTRCSGKCPAYTVRLGANGTVQWHGEDYVTTLGDATGQVDAAAAANLIQRMRDYGFDLLCGSYSRPVTNEASSLTTISVAGRTRQVRDYAASAPAWLRDFDDRVDALADTHRWRHGDPSSELFGETHLAEDARYAKAGRTMLMQVAVAPGRGVIKVLLEQQRVPVNAEDGSGWNALMYMAGAGSLNQVQQLLTNGADATHRSHAGETLLFAAASSTDNPVPKLKVLQRAGANATAVANNGMTVLMIAAAHYWQAGLLKTVLDMGVDPSVRNQQGQTALDVLEKTHTKIDVPGAYEEAHALLSQAH